MKRLSDAVRLDRDTRIRAMLAAGKSRQEMADALGLTYDGLCSWLSRLRRIDPAIFGTVRKSHRRSLFNRTETAEQKEQLAELDEALGRPFVRRVLGRRPDLEGVELQRLHAALRAVLLDAETLVVEVARRMKEARREGLAERATAHMGEMRGPT